MNLKIVLRAILICLFSLSLLACAPKQILLVDTDLNQVMHQIAEIPSGVESGTYHLFCYEDLNLHYWWTAADKTIQDQDVFYTTSLSYVPRSSRVTVYVTATKNTHIVFNYGVEFDRGTKDWGEGLLLLAKAEDYEEGVTKSLESIDINQILTSVDNEAPILLSQYACVYAD